MSEQSQSVKQPVKVTMKQIAAEAGVSVAAVSMALNNKKGVSREKADNLKRIAREMGYISEQSHKPYSHTLNLIQPLKAGSHRNDLYKTLIAEFFQAIAKEAGALDYGFEIHTRETQDMNDIVGLINDSTRDGTVIMGAALDRADIELLSTIDSPLVIVEGFDRGIHADMVSLNNDQVIHDLINYLISKGHKKIGIVQDDSYSYNLEVRETAFFHYVKQAGLILDDNWYFKAPADETGTKILANLISSRNSHPTALMCVNDIMAYHASHACQDLGFSIPADIAIAGIDDLPASRLMRPQLTTVRVSRSILARRTMQLLTDRLTRYPEKPPEHISVGGIVIERESA